MSRPTQDLLDRLDERGWKARIVPIDRLAELEGAIRSQRDAGLLHAALDRAQLHQFSFTRPADLPDARSIIAVAVPVPQVRIIFHWRGAPVPIVLPPTYVSYTPTTIAVQNTLARWLALDGFQVARPRLPLKTLAAGSGLAAYGRNNLCYVSGLGSFLRLVAAFSDLSSDGASWRVPASLDRYPSCVACLRPCPTGAAAPDRFLLHAERCLTYHNEAAADFPAWIDPSWHHCLVGCMRCQTTRPGNKRVVEWFDDRLEFSEDEAALIVSRTPLSNVPKPTAAKLRGLELTEDYQFLCRNLSMLLN